MAAAGPAGPEQVKRLPPCLRAALLATSAVWAPPPRGSGVRLKLGRRRGGGYDDVADAVMAVPQRERRERGAALCNPRAGSFRARFFVGSRGRLGNG